MTTNNDVFLATFSPVTPEEVSTTMTEFSALSTANQTNQSAIVFSSRPVNRTAQDGLYVVFFKIM